MDLNNVLKTIDWSSSKEQLIQEIASFTSKLWQVHPFREGNTRCIITFLYFLLKQNKIELKVDMLKTHSKYLRNALVMASIDEYSEFQYLESILGEAIFGITDSTTKGNIKSNSKYKKIKNIDIEHYQFNYHTLKK